MLKFPELKLAVELPDPVNTYPFVLSTKVISTDCLF